MLSAPGLCFYWALAPFRQLDVGPAHPVVGGVLGCTRFYFSCFSCILYLILYISLCLFVFRVSLHSLGSLGVFMHGRRVT